MSLGRGADAKRAHSSQTHLSVLAPSICQRIEVLFLAAPSDLSERVSDAVIFCFTNQGDLLDSIDGNLLDRSGC